MASSEELSVKISADASDFRESMNDVRNSMSNIKSNFALAKSSVVDFGNSAEGLKAKSTFLSQSLEVQSHKVSALKIELERTKAQFGENSNEAQKMGRQLQYAEAEENNLKNRLKETNTQLDLQSNKWRTVGQKLQEVGEKMRTSGERMSSIGKNMTASITMPMIGVAVEAIKSASDLNETISKTDVVFGNSAKQVEEWANSSIKNFGMAKGTTLDMVSTYGDMATGMGFAQDAASKMGEQLVGRAADLASFKNISVDVAKTALTGVFSGEGESLKGLGVIMTQANLQQYAYSQGVNKKIGEMSQAELVQLRYNYVMEQTKNAEGDFQRTSSGTANSMRIAQESIKQLQAELAEKLLPAITPVINKLTDLVNGFGKLDGGTQNVILTIAGVVALAGPLLNVIGLISQLKGGIVSSIGKITEAVATGEGLLGAVLSPIGLIVTAVGAITAGLIYLWNTNEGFRNGVTEIWNGLVANLKTAWEGFKQAFESVVNALKVVWEVIVGAFSVVFYAVVDTLKATWNMFKDAFTNICNMLEPIWRPIANLISDVWNQVVGSLKDVWNGFKDAFDSVGNALKTAWTAVGDLFKDVWHGVSSSVIDAWNAIKAPFQAVFDWIGNLWQGIKSFFKLPHFHIEGSMNPLKWVTEGVPRVKVDWYADGGIFTRPTVLNGGIGVGDARAGRGSNAEAVLPLNVLWEQLNNNFNKLASNLSGNVIVPIYMDSNQIAQYTYNKFDNKMAMANRRAR